MTRFVFEQLLNRISGNLGSYLKETDPVFFDMLFFDFWIEFHVNSFAPDTDKFIVLPSDPFTYAYYEKTLNKFNNLGSLLRQTDPLLFQLSFYQFWLCHTPKQIRRASVIKVKKYKNDPVKFKSKFAGKCSKCQKPIAKGEEIIYFPSGKHAFHLSCGESDYNRFQASAMDEEIYNQRY